MVSIISRININPSTLSSQIRSHLCARRVAFAFLVATWLTLAAAAAAAARQSTDRTPGQALQAPPTLVTCALVALQLVRRIGAKLDDESASFGAASLHLGLRSAKLACVCVCACASQQPRDRQTDRLTERECFISQVRLLLLQLFVSGRPAGRPVRTIEC